MEHIYYYRAPNQSATKVTEFCKILNEHTNKLKNTNTIVTGDFNFNILAKTDNNVQKYINTLLSNNLHLCDHNTITREISSTSLDHIHTNFFASHINLQYVPYDILDHRLIFIEINNTKFTTTNMNKPKTIKIINYDKLQQTLIESPINLNTVYLT